MKLPPDKATTAVNHYVAQMLAANARRLAAQRAPDAPLKSIMADWFESLPHVSRFRRFGLTEISDAMEDRTSHRHANKDLSAALLALGFTRGRDWTKAGKDSRYWLPPSNQL